MANMDEIKRVFTHVFTRDVRTVEPKRKGLIVGENLRVYDEPGPAVLSFLKGTDQGARKKVTDKLDEQKVEYKIGDDFAT